MSSFKSAKAVIIKEGIGVIINEKIIDTNRAIITQSVISISCKYIGCITVNRQISQRIVHQRVKNPFS